MNMGYLYALITALLWSFSGLCTRYVSANSFVYSGIVSTVALILTCLTSKQKVKLSLFTILVGICQFMMVITFVFANRLTTIGNTIVLQYSSIIFVLVFEAVETHRLPKRYQLVVMILAILGMVIFFLDGFDFSSILGNTLAIISGVFFGLQFYLNTKEHADPGSSLLVQYVLAIICMIASIMAEKTIHLSMHDFILTLIIGIVITFFSGVYFAKCIKLIPAFTANVICMSEIFLAPLWALLFLGEKSSPTSAIGAAFMIFALFYNVYKEHEQLTKRRIYER